MQGSGESVAPYAGVEAGPRPIWPGGRVAIRPRSLASNVATWPTCVWRTFAGSSSRSRHHSMASSGGGREISTDSSTIDMPGRSRRSRTSSDRVVGSSSQKRATPNGASAARSTSWLVARTSGLLRSSKSRRRSRASRRRSGSTIRSRASRSVDSHAPASVGHLGTSDESWSCPTMPRSVASSHGMKRPSPRPTRSAVARSDGGSSTQAQARRESGSFQPSLVGLIVGREAAPDGSGTPEQA
jgi:hypothetical protein